MIPADGKAQKPRVVDCRVHRNNRVCGCARCKNSVELGTPCEIMKQKDATGDHDGREESAQTTFLGRLPERKEHRTNGTRMESGDTALESRLHGLFPE